MDDDRNFIAGAFIDALRNVRNYVAKAPEPDIQNPYMPPSGSVKDIALNFLPSERSSSEWDKWAQGNSPIVATPTGKPGRRAFDVSFKPGRGAPAVEAALDLPIGTASMAGKVAGKGLMAGARVLGENALTPVARNAAERGAIVWHGSPYSFDKFDFSKIGTGEGAQVYGHGLYFAESPETGLHYRKALSPSAGPTWRGKLLSEVDPNEIGQAGVQVLNNIDRYNGNIHAVRRYLENREDYYARSHETAKKINDSYQGAEWAKNRVEETKARLADITAQLSWFYKNQKLIGQRDTGYLYKVDIPDPQIEKMLDLDKRLMDQTTSVPAQHASTIPDRHILSTRLSDRLKAGDVSGKDYYHLLSKLYGGPEEASRILYEKGVPGSKYLDQLSRIGTSDTRNIVTFSDVDPTILMRNEEIINALRRR